MRWLALLLLLANVLLAVVLWSGGAWQALFRAQAASAPPRPAAWLRADTLTLLVESDRVTERARLEPAAGGLPALGERCVRIGPFATTAALEPLRQRLAALGVTVLAGRSEQAAAAGAAGGVIVRLLDIPTPSVAERTVAELQALDIEAFVISEGQHAPGVSLGLFPTEALARSRIDEADALGFPSAASPVAGTRVLHWLLAGSAALTGLAPGTLADADWSLVQTGYEGRCARIAAEIGLQ